MERLKEGGGGGEGSGCPPPPPPSYICSRPTFPAGKAPKTLCSTETLATQANFCGTTFVETAAESPSLLVAVPSPRLHVGYRESPSPQVPHVSCTQGPLSNLICTVGVETGHRVRLRLAKRSAHMYSAKNEYSIIKDFLSTCNCACVLCLSKVPLSQMVLNDNQTRIW